MLVNTYLEILLPKYKKKGIIIDSNLALVYFIGDYNKELIEKFKNTEGYSIEDYDLIKNIIEFFYPSPIITTPNILTEVYNLSNQLPEKIKIEYFENFRDKIIILSEKYYQSLLIVKNEFFSRFGLTDISIVLAAYDKKYLVFSADLPLINLLDHLKIDAINWNNIRTFKWFY